MVCRVCLLLPGGGGLRLGGRLFGLFGGDILGAGGFFLQLHLGGREIFAMDGAPSFAGGSLHLLDELGGFFLHGPDGGSSLFPDLWGLLPHLGGGFRVHLAGGFLNAVDGIIGIHGAIAVQIRVRVLLFVVLLRYLNGSIGGAGGNTQAQHVTAQVGPEQEYFLIDKEMYRRREDLVLCGRTLFGAKPPKGQELDDHYFGIIKQRVLSFMKDLDDELWKLGVLAKTEHNEVAPAQHELAPIFTTTNVASDHNQLMMEFMKRVALRHGLVCLLHEKPFDGVNGSGKHNNWSLSTEEGLNLLDPGKEPYKNIRFLTFLAAIIKAVDEYQDLLRVSVASAGNDHRLGANEAPPAIVSMFLGTELTAVLEAIAADKVYNGNPESYIKVSDDTIPALVKDNTDRNRTSPFAFTGNKFEFRMLGSMFSIAGPNIVLNTIVAEELDEFADKLADAPDLEAAVYDLVKETYKAHKRIVFNGNGYTDAWVEEAAKRGLLNLKSTPEALPYLGHAKNIELFEKHNIFTKAEVESRVEILLENYSTTISIEAATMLDMFHKDILPAVTAYTGDLTKAVLDKKAAGISAGFEGALADKLSKLGGEMYASSLKLEDGLKEAVEIGDSEKQALYYHDTVLEEMGKLRSAVDAAEALTGGKYLDYPTYGELLFGVNE